MQFTILDTNTRVIKRLTSDIVPQILASETAVDTSANPLTLTGFSKLDLDNKTLLVPTQAEIDLSGVDENRNAVLRQQKVQAYKDSIDNLLSNIDAATLSTIKPLLKQIFQTLKQIL